MGFTSEQNASTGSATGDKYSKDTSGPSFGQRLGNYFESRYPIAGALGQAAGVLPGQQQAPISHVDPSYGGPTAQPAQSDMLALNAQPKQGSGLATILKLIAGA